MIRSFFILLFSIVCLNFNAQSFYTYSGIVFDNQTNSPLADVSVSVLDTERGVLTDEDGRFQIKARLGERIVFSFLGYKTQTVEATASTSLQINLRQEARQLKEVVVKRNRYSNKNNPAVQLIRNVIDRKDDNQKMVASCSHVKKYEKTLFAINDITESVKKQKAFRKLDFLFANTDTTKLPGKEVLPFYINEKISDLFFTKSPKREKEIVDARQMVKIKWFDIDDEGLAEYMNYLYQDINIYDDNIFFLTNSSLGPLAKIAPNFYRYYIVDTLLVGQDECIKVFYAARNKNDLLYTGHLYVTTDGDYAIRKAEIGLDKRVNINWVRGVNLVQEFEKSSHRGWALSESRLLIDFFLINQFVGILGERYQRFEEKTTDSLSASIDTIISGSYQEVSDSAYSRSPQYWETHRLTPLNRSEIATYSAMDSLQNMRVFKAIMRTGGILGSGFVPVCKYFDLGPIFGLYGYNRTEGHRTRLGIRTTDSLSMWFNLQAYAAYGFGDKQWKYFARTYFSFNHNSYYLYPKRGLSLTYKYDIHKPGDDFGFNSTTLFQSISGRNHFRHYYTEEASIEHVYEFDFNFSYLVGFKYKIQRPGGELYFNKTDYLSHVNTISLLNMSEAYISLRYAPFEKFYQGKKSRNRIRNPYPVLQLSYNVGQKIWGNHYNYHKLKFNYSQRIYLSVAGYLDVELEAGKVFGTVPFPYLTTFETNQNFWWKDAYQLMNYLEFVSDQYLSLSIDLRPKGFFFDKIPGLNYLHLHEILGVKVLWGNVAKNNDPKTNSDLLRLPINVDGTPMTYMFGKIPYVEMTAGIGNIFKLINVCYVHRFTYLNNVNAPKWAIRIGFDLTF